MNGPEAAAKKEIQFCYRDQNLSQMSKMGEFKIINFVCFQYEGTNWIIKTHQNAILMEDSKRKTDFFIQRNFKEH
jgi:hypothetical protein